MTYNGYYIVIVGGYESGIDAALADLGHGVLVVDEDGLGIMLSSS
jgi:hypothetical protein